MKMLFFSSDPSEVEHVRREFALAGIACEVRHGTVSHGRALDAELWIQHDTDCHRAFLLCVQQGMGFARRPADAIQPVDVEPAEAERPVEPAQVDK